MSYKQLKFSKERQLRSSFCNDKMLELETGQMSRILPTEIKLIICNMLIGFPGFCLGAREAELDQNGIQNMRDIKCLVWKFFSEPPQNDNYTCWACLDFLKKFNPEVWKERTRCKKKFNPVVGKERTERWAVQHSVDRPQRSLNATFMNKKTVFKIWRQLSENDKNRVVIKRSFGEIIINPSMDYHSPFHHEFWNRGSNKMPICPHVPVCSLQGNINLCCLQSRKI